VSDCLEGQGELAESPDPACNVARCIERPHPLWDFSVQVLVMQATGKICSQRFIPGRLKVAYCHVTTD
jgi:hypothetical protein